MSRPIYTVTRRGKFAAKLVPENQCGTKGTGKFEYEATVKGVRLGLINKILIEHFDVDATITKTFGHGKWRGSCEAIAGKIVQIIRDEYTSSVGMDPDFVSVTLKPGEIASIGVEWHRYDDAPFVAVNEAEEKAAAKAAKEEQEEREERKEDRSPRC